MDNLGTETALEEARAAAAALDTASTLLWGERLEGWQGPSADAARTRLDAQRILMWEAIGAVTTATVDLEALVTERAAAYQLALEANPLAVTLKPFPPLLETSVWGTAEEDELVWDAVCPAPGGAR